MKWQLNVLNLCLRSFLGFKMNERRRFESEQNLKKLTVRGIFRHAWIWRHQKHYSEGPKVSCLLFIFAERFLSSTLFWKKKSGMWICCLNLFGPNMGRRLLFSSVWRKSCPQLWKCTMTDSKTDCTNVIVWVVSLPSKPILKNDFTVTARDEKSATQHLSWSWRLKCQYTNLHGPFHICDSSGNRGAGHCHFRCFVHFVCTFSETGPPLPETVWCGQRLRRETPRETESEESRCTWPWALALNHHLCGPCRLKLKAIATHIKYHEAVNISH